MFEFVITDPIADRAWWISTEVTGQGIKNRLDARAEAVGLYAAPYAPGDIGNPDYVEQKSL